MEELLKKIYNRAELTQNMLRYEAAEKKFHSLFGADGTPSIFSAPGRTEICGNHTDHNNGLVMAAAVSSDVIAFVMPVSENTVTVHSEGFDAATVNLSSLSVNENEKNTSAALIRGVADGFVRHGFKIGGFKAYMTSTVPEGSGMSSSAAFEVILGNIFSGLYNGGSVDAVTIAKIAQYAENVHFGKPSGLMDQTASSVGGFITVDFLNPDEPQIESLSFDLESYGMNLCLIDTKGSHSNLTPDYASIPAEMKSIAEYFGKNTLREVEPSQLFNNIAELRQYSSDRAVLRAFHFFDENMRVSMLSDAIANDDIASFLYLINQSGNSSYKYLQNIYSPASPTVQGISVALCLAEHILDGQGACRVHGGGFAGTVQTFVPTDLLGDFIGITDSVFGIGSCNVLSVRQAGGIQLR